MGGGESSNSSDSQSRPLTAAERQDLYRSSIGNILNTYTESGLPYGGQGSMNATNATFNPYATAPTQGTNGAGTQVTSPVTGLYNATGGATSPYDQSHPGEVTWDPKSFVSAPSAQVNMPTGAADPGGINLPVYQTPQYQSPGQFQKGGYTAGLDYAKGQDIKNVNQDLANRGIWSTGLADAAVQNREAGYAPAYEKAGADQATAQNAYNQNAADSANNFNVTNTNNAYQAGWQPLQFLQGLWNGTSGQTSGSSSFGQSLNMKF